MISVIQEQIDCCPHCGDPFQIVCVKFGPRGAATESVCPNCAIVPAAPAIAKQQSAASTRYFWRRLAKVNSLKLRTRRVVAFVIAAVTFAAVLRHGFHVYGGYSRPEIAVGALIALPTVMLIFHLLRKR
jgi:hypothetical protein